MMIRGIKKKDHEKLSSVNIRETIELLESGTPFTKKEACLKLNIAYNTARLGNIIADYNERIAFTERRKSQNKGKRATSYEIVEAIVMYLNKEPVSAIASSLYRSDSFVRGIISRTGLPEYTSKEGRDTYDLLPDSMIDNAFTQGELVWSAQHHGLAQVKKEITLKEQEKPGYFHPINYEERDGSKLYSIYVLEKGDYSNSFFPNVQCGGFFSCSHAYDLGKLDHLVELGVDLSRLEK